MKFPAIPLLFCFLLLVEHCLANQCTRFGHRCVAKRRCPRGSRRGYSGCRGVCCALRPPSCRRIGGNCLPTRYNCKVLSYTYTCPRGRKCCTWRLS
uniref:Carboxypeptidase inhibitor n=1 Tax=Amblyomma maculatum TaxID=34609 RepID=G3MR94_AMBMU